MAELVLLAIIAVSLFVAGVLIGVRYGAGVVANAIRSEMDAGMLSRAQAERILVRIKP